MLTAQQVPGDGRETTGTRVFVVEDDDLLSQVLQDALSAIGCTVSKASNITEGIDLATSMDADVAVLDMNIAGRPVFPIAVLLRQRGIPFIFVTAYFRTEVPGEFADVPRLHKPFRLADLEEAVRRSVEAA